ncbi:MAG: peroxiredoxin family protein [Pyrinomonadaceae bacterium]
MRSIVITLFSAALAFSSASFLAAQTNAGHDLPVVVALRAKPPPKTIFRDSDGNLISNNEFVDIRMANFHIRDATMVNILTDGTTVFQLQKVPQEGAEAPNFTARTIEGFPVSLSSYKGKVVVLNFWFIGCAVCRAEMPKLNQFAAKFAGEPDIEFIAMTADPAQNVRKYLAVNRFDYKQVTDARPALSMFVVGGYPKSIVIDKDGRILYWRSTVKAWDKFESVIRSELTR